MHISRPSPAAAALAVALVGVGVGCSHGQHGSEPASTTRPAATSTTLSDADIERQVRAAYEHFRVRLRDLLVNPDPNSPIIEEVWGKHMRQGVRDTQARNVADGYHAESGPTTRWRVQGVEVMSPTEVLVTDCVVDGERVMKGAELVNDASNTYSSLVTFRRIGQSWLVDAVAPVQRWEGVAGCALED